MINNSQQKRLNIVYFLEKEFKFVPKRPHLLAMSKHCNLLCVDPPVSIDLLFRKPGKLFNWLFNRKLRKYETLAVYTPFAFTSYGISDAFSLFKSLNRWIVSRFIRSVLKKQGLKNVIWGMSYPQQDYLLKFFGNDPFFYSIRDLIGATSSPKALERLQEKENRILRKASVVFTTSLKLYDLKKTQNPNTFYRPNGADVHHFSMKRNLSQTAPEDIKTIQKPIIGFAGNISNVVDIKLLIDIAKRYPRWSIVLVGTINCEKENMVSDINRLITSKNVFYLGLKPYEILPQYIGEFDVCLLPFSKNLWMEYSFPNKIVQYLALGKPVVSTDFPVARLFEDVITVCKDKEAFISVVGKNAEKKKNVAEIQRRIETALKYDVSSTAIPMIEAMESIVRKGGNIL